eukprot:768522-Hanusia_phi.AAC.2
MVSCLDQRLWTPCRRYVLVLSFLLASLTPHARGKVVPSAVATWKFGEIAVREAAKWLEQGACAVDAAERAVNAVELDTQEQYFVGLGGLPNRDGVMELDAAIMRGCGSQLGCVLALQGISTPVSVARRLMEHGQHTVLAGRPPQVEEPNSLRWSKVSGKRTFLQLQGEVEERAEALRMLKGAFAAAERSLRCGNAIRTILMAHRSRTIPSASCRQLTTCSSALSLTRLTSVADAAMRLANWLWQHPPVGGSSRSSLANEGFVPSYCNRHGRCREESETLLLYLTLLALCARDSAHQVGSGFYVDQTCGAGRSVRSARCCSDRR